MGKQSSAVENQRSRLPADLDGRSVGGKEHATACGKSLIGTAFGNDTAPVEPPPVWSREAAKERGRRRKAWVQGKTRPPAPAGRKKRFSRNSTSRALQRRDLHVGRNIRVPALLAARIDCRGRVAIRLPIHHVAVCIQSCRGEHRVDLRERPARRARIQRTIYVVARNARRRTPVPR